jgi:hypothetical protein
MMPLTVPLPQVLADTAVVPGWQLIPAASNAPMTFDFTVPPNSRHCSRSRSGGPIAPAETLAWTLACRGCGSPRPASARRVALLAAASAQLLDPRQN